ncbi:MAG: ABC transporter permease [Nitrospinae bacterium]|nr:ABC transporter permease [Nitrospinota bacterium]
MIKKFLEILEYRELLQTLATKELIARYHASALGYLWVLLNPFLMMLLFTLVFSVFLRIQVENYALFFICAMLPWNFFANSLNQGSSSLVGNTHFILKFYCPRELFPLKVVLAHAFVLLNGFVALVPVILYFKGSLSWAILLVPVVVFFHVLFAAGLTLMLSTLHVFFRDVTHLLEFFTVVWYFLTPVFYPLSMVPETLQPLFRLNPMYVIISLYRDILYLGVVPGLESFLAAAAIGLGTLIVGWKTFLAFEHAVVKEL